MREQYLKQEHSWDLYRASADGGTGRAPQGDRAESDRTDGTLISKMVSKEGLSEELKATNQMEWIRRMNSIHQRAEEMVKSEIIYA